MKILIIEDLFPEKKKAYLKAFEKFLKSKGHIDKPTLLGKWFRNKIRKQEKERLRQDLILRKHFFGRTKQNKTKQNNMNATGKKARKASGLNRYEIHFNEHSNKSDVKRQKSHWGKKGTRMAMKEGKFSKV